jgi:hypothetical protein
LCVRHVCVTDDNVFENAGTGLPWEETILINILKTEITPCRITHVKNLTCLILVKKFLVFCGS